MSYTTPVWLRFLLAVRFYALPLIGALSFVLPTQVFLLALSPNLNLTPFVWLAIGLGYASHLVMARVWLAFPKVVGAHTGALSSLCVLTCMLILDFYTLFPQPAQFALVCTSVIVAWFLHTQLAALLDSRIRCEADTFLKSIVSIKSFYYWYIQARLPFTLMLVGEASLVKVILTKQTKLIDCGSESYKVGRVWESTSHSPLFGTIVKF